MEPLMSADEPNDAAILAQIDKVAQARAELEKANARFLLAIRGQADAGAVEAGAGVPARPRNARPRGTPRMGS